MDGETILFVQNLGITAGGRPLPRTLLADVCFSISKGSSLGVVGESGSGKSLSCRAILRLLPRGLAISSGAIYFEGVDLLTLPESEIRGVRGRKVGLIQQDPMTALNPVQTIGEQIAEPIRYHLRVGRYEARVLALDALRELRIPNAEKRYHDYPHQLSGGMRQRVAGAIAISCRPQLLIADEPTTSLDVTTQAHYLELLANLQQRHGLAILLVTHDLGVVAQTCHNVVVMYRGRVIETGQTGALFRQPLHPYTATLLAAMRGPTGTSENGQDPSHTTLKGCPYRSSCASAMPVCAEESPPFASVGSGRAVACWLHTS